MNSIDGNGSFTGRHRMLVSRNRKYERIEKLFWAAFKKSV